VGGRETREERLIELIKALGHPLRINILRMLRGSRRKAVPSTSI
jgi:DNA-binding transcriptional ArsR family regulator